MKAGFPWLWLVLSLAAPEVLGAEAEAFKEANTLYFAGKPAEAAAAYGRLLSNSPPSAVLYFNLGNAWFKAGQHGRAVAAYLHALHLEPRDPAVRFNLKFVRQKVTGTDVPGGTVLERALASLTLNEWSLLAAAAFWCLFILLALREIAPALRKPVRNLSLLAGLGTVLLAGCLTAAFRQQSELQAVVIEADATVRNGPLDASPAAFTLRDGSEVSVKDEQEITEQGQPQRWLQIQDRSRRLGWIKREKVILLD
jgi:hypothetical protein